MFTNRMLKKLTIPSIIEQTLAVAVGMADIIMVTEVGESAVSGVSLVDTVGILLINLFGTLATGGAVVAAQYIGQKNKEKACVAANQLLLSVFVISIFIMAISLIGNKLILQAIFGKVDADVMSSARVYFYITAISYPFLGIYNACAALYRSMGNSKVSMKTSLLMNLINILGNAICIYLLKMGVEGVALPTLISRTTAALVMLYIIRNENNVIHVDKYLKLGYDWSMIKRILRIGVPNGVENSLFQVGKILVQSVIAKIGTAAMAANAVANTVAQIEIIPANAIGLAMITVVGQCIGASEEKQAKEYTKKLLKWSYVTMIIMCVTVAALLLPILSLYSLSTDTKAIAIQLILFHSIIGAIIWPASFTMPSAFRAAGDVKFTMLVAIFSMWIFRIALSYVLVYAFDMGVLGVWVAMSIDWVARVICFIYRYRSGKWLDKKIV